MRKTIKILIGPPLSGKSTYIKDNATYDEVILSRDSIILELHPELKYTDAFNVCNQKEVDRLFKSRFAEYISEGKSLVIDKTNLSSKTRRKLLNRVPADYYKIAVLFNWDKKVLLERNIKREAEEGKFIPLKVIDDMLDSYVPIKDDEGFDKIIYLK